MTDRPDDESGRVVRVEHYVWSHPDERAGLPWIRDSYTVMGVNAFRRGRWEEAVDLFRKGADYEFPWVAANQNRGKDEGDGDDAEWVEAGQPGDDDRRVPIAG